MVYELQYEKLLSKADGEFQIGLMGEFAIGISGVEAELSILRDRQTAPQISIR